MGKNNSALYSCIYNSQLGDSLTLSANYTENTNGDIRVSDVFLGNDKIVYKVIIPEFTCSPQIQAIPYVVMEDSVCLIHGPGTPCFIYNPLATVNIFKADTNYNVTVDYDVMDGTRNTLFYSFSGFLQSVCFADTMCYINPQILLDAKAAEIKKSMDSLAYTIFNRKLILQRPLYCK